MTLRLTFAEEPQLPIQLQAGSLTTAQLSTNENLVLFYGVLSLEGTVIQNSALFSYALNEGYTISERSLTTLESDLKNEKPIAVVINLDSVAFEDLAFGLFSLVPQYKNQTLFFLSSEQTVSNNLISFWRNFGVIDVITVPVDPIGLFAAIKLGAGYLNPTELVQIDFTLSTSTPLLFGQRGTDVNFSITVTATKGSGFPVDLKATAFTNNVAFFPQVSVPNFTSIMRVRIDLATTLGSKSIIVTATSGSVQRSLEVTLVVM